MRPFLPLALLLLTAPLARAQDLLAQIRALPHVAEAIEQASPIPTARIMRIRFTQPVDHRNPNSATFTQRINLLHRATGAPMVLSTQGYNVPPAGAQRELTALFQANQLDIEHRFFAESTPAVPSWEHLTIEQAAADHHRIVESFKRLYGGKWVSTGSSKGGMTSVYHRFFYPNDVDATVPYVAPSSRGTRDARYVPFVRRVGTPECRARLRAFQETALTRRDELLPRMPPIAFQSMGKERAFEFAILELPFFFWQYQSERLCASIPPPDAPAEDLMTFIVIVADPEQLADEFLRFYAPYFYQAATELGGPRYDECSLANAAQRTLRQIAPRRRGTDPAAVCRLFLFPAEDVPARYPPLDVAKTFDGETMPLVERWVRDEGRRFLFINGANDPWSATAFDADARNDSHVFFVTGVDGNHRASIMKLSPADRERALARLSEWLGISPVGLQPGATETERRARQIDPPSAAELWIR